MFRPLFWLGLLGGGLASFGARRAWLPRPPAPQADPLLDLFPDAVIRCDASGRVTRVNAAARALGDRVGDLPLRYPSGQPVPPGQMPWTRARLSRRRMTGGGYLLTGPDGAVRVLDIDAHPLGNGGAVAVLRDVTTSAADRARAAAAQAYGQVLCGLGRRLDAAPDQGEAARAAAGAALGLLEGLPGAQVRLYLRDADVGRLTLLAAAPDDRPKRPRSRAQARASDIPFDAAVPWVWKVYVAREAYADGDALLLPLLACGVALGHLMLNARNPKDLEDGPRREALTLLAAMASLSLAGLVQAARAGALTAQAEALGDVARAASSGATADALADLVIGHVRRIVGAEVCVVAWRDADRLRLAGTSFRDALLFPEKHAPDDPLLCDPAARKAVKTGRAVTRAALPNPAFGASPWRAFAGQSGTHTVLALPLAGRRGALTVYGLGSLPPSDAHVTFVESLASLLSLSPPQATDSGAPSGA